jgi:1,4-dihydroxy-2-naphthoate octaprenyltransferase
MGTAGMAWQRRWRFAPLRTMLMAEGRALNPALKGTARLHLVFGLLLALGMVV